MEAKSMIAWEDGIEPSKELLMGMVEDKIREAIGNNGGSNEAIDCLADALMYIHELLRKHS